MERAILYPVGVPRKGETDESGEDVGRRCHQQSNVVGRPIFNWETHVLLNPETCKANNTGQHSVSDSTLGCIHSSLTKAIDDRREEEVESIG